MIEVRAVLNNLNERLERIASLRPPGIVRGQVAGDNVRAGQIEIRVNYNLTEVLSAGQIDGRVDLCGLAELGVTVSSVIEVGSAAAVVAPIAIRHRVHQPAPISHQVPVLRCIGRMDRRGL